MKHSNNYFQKGIIVLVIAMLLTIPNIRVYSAIGSYQTSSPAITANNKKHPNTEGMMIGLDAIAFAIGIICVASAVGFLVAGLGIEEFVHISVSVGGKATERPDLVIKNYHKYDFSQFDN